MPLYEYTCQACGLRFELLRKLSDSDSTAACPRCGSHRIVRELSAVHGLPAGGGTKSCGTGRFG